MDTDHYAKLVESITDGLISLNRDWCFTFVNARAAQNVPFAPEELLGKNIWEIFPHLCGTPLEEHYRRAMDAGESRVFEMQGLRPGQWYQVSVYPSAEGITVYYQDSTSRKAGEAELARLIAENRRQEALLDSIFDVDPSGMAVVTGPDLRFAYTNPAYRFICPRPGEDLTDQPYEAVWTGRDDCFYTHQIRQVLQTGKPFQTLGFERRYEDGSRRTFTFQVRRIDWEDQPAALLILWDTTGLKRIEKALRHANETTEQHLTQLRTVLDNMNEGLFLFDGEGKILLANRAMHALSGLDTIPQELFGTYANRLEVRDAQGRVLSTEEMPPARALQGETVRDAEYSVRRLDTGKRYTAIFNAVPVRDLQGRVNQIVLTIQDITQRKQTEADRRKLLLAVEQSPTTIVITDLNGSIEYVNPKFSELTGYSAEEAMGLNPSVLKSGLTPREVYAHLWKTIRAGEIWRGEFCNKKRNGELYWESASIAPVTGEDGQITHFLAVKQDITERKQAEQALRESEERARTQAAEINAVFDSMSDAVVVFDTGGKAVHANRAAVEMYGFDPCASGRPPEAWTLSNCLPDGQTVEPEALPYIRALRGELVEGELYRFTNLAGRPYTILASASPLYTADQQLNGAMAIWHDVTERVQIEEAARQAAAQIEVQHALLEQREQERLQIARDLHDGPVQELTGVNFELHGMLLDGLPPEIAGQVQAISAAIQGQIAELRGYASELRPPALAKFGLAKAIRSHLETFQEKHPELKIDFQESQAGGLLPEDIRLALYRIYQESLTNIAKHARATEICVRLITTADAGILQVQDNGVGFDVPRDWLALARRGHLGLVGLRERAQAVGGTVTITSRSGAGALIQVTVPLRK